MFVSGGVLNSKASQVTPQAGRVLVVDDEAAMRRLYSRALSRAGFDVIVADGGAEGLQRLREDAGIRLVLLDLNMPGIDGWGFREAQRSDPQLRDIPTVIVTGAPLSEVVSRELHAAQYLLKPVRPEYLVSLVADYCEPVAW